MNYPEHIAALEAIAKDILAKLLTHPSSARLDWRIILNRIFPGESARTFRCDPSYDLQELKTSAVVRVEPYAGQNWQESQRYPTVEIIWRRE